MEMEVVKTHLAPKAVGPYSQGIVCRPFYFFSGQIGLHPETGEMMRGIEEETKQIFRNLEGLLRATGLTPQHVVKGVVFLTTMDHFPVVNHLYEAFFSTPYPARSCVAVASLPKGALVEMEFTAYNPQAA